MADPRGPAAAGPKAVGMPAIESRVWQHEAFQSRHCEAAAFRPEAAQELRARIEDQPADLRRKVYELTRARSPGHVSRRLVRGAPRPGRRGRGGRAARGRSSSRRHGGSRNNDGSSGRSVLQRIPRATRRRGFAGSWLRLPRSAYQGKAARPCTKSGPWSSRASDRPPDGLDPARLPPTRGFDANRRAAPGSRRPRGSGRAGNPAGLGNRGRPAAPPGSLVGSDPDPESRIKVESVRPGSTASASGRPPGCRNGGRISTASGAAFRVQGGPSAPALDPAR